MRSSPILLALLAAGAAFTAGAAACGDDGGGAGTDAPPGSDPDAAPGDVDAPPAGEPPGLEGTVAAHNAVRAEVGVGPLTWEPALATIAANWAAQCVDTEQPIGLVDHNAGRSDGYPTYVGENIYGSGGQATGTDAVALWASEKAHYDHATNTCAAGQICGHYTQLVWRATTKVGCALHHCPNLQFGWTVVCDYAPGGNIGNQSPY
ncbi:MAG TPA: CAP domain-containing protein [Kofleriaceae bacterium]|nr:CAP domain-containing protein [Kofleriaceae bacterium]